MQTVKKNLYDFKGILKKDSFFALYILIEIALFVVISFSIFCVFAWIFTSDPQKLLASPIKFNTTLGLFFSSLCTLSLYLLPQNQNSKSKLLTKTAGTFCFFLGFLTFIQYPLKVDLHIDQLFITAVSDQLAGQEFPGRMSPISALCFLSLGLSLYYHNKIFGKNFIFSYFLQLFTFIVSFAAVVGYLYEQPELYQMGHFVKIAFITAVSICIICAALLVHTSRYSSYNLLLSKNLGGVILRRLLPVTFFIPIALGYIWVKLVKVEVANRIDAISIFVSLFISIFLLIIFWLSQKIEDMDKDQNTILSNKRKLREELKYISDSFKLSESKFKIMSDSMPLMVWSALPDGRPDYFNKKWYDFTGVSEGDTHGIAAGVLSCTQRISH